MDNGSSNTYTVRISLVTEAGDLPNRRDVEDMIAAQMGGELDDPACNGGTGLFCGGVTVIGSDADAETDPFGVITSLAREARDAVSHNALGVAMGLLADIINYIDAECV